MKREPAFRLPCHPDDLVRHALAAYYRAIGDAIAPIGEPDTASWSSPEDFIGNLCDLFELRVRADAARAGHPVDADLGRLRLVEAILPCRDQHIRDVDPGRWDELCAQAGPPVGDAPGCRGGAPAVKGHGCPALSPAVGPAPAGPAAALHNSPDAPLFCARTVQDLPASGFHEDNRPAAVGRGT